MTIEEMRDLVEGVVQFEREESDDVLGWNIGATTDAITEHLLKTGVYDRAKDLEQWRFDETIHLSALDYFSSFEPVFVTT